VLDIKQFKNHVATEWE